MKLLKTSLWTGLSTVIKVLAGIVTTKIMAIYVGPAGVALLGNFTNITGILTIFANGAIGSGVTKYISEFESENEKQNVISLAVKISLICSILIGTIILIFHKSLSYYAFGDTVYDYAFVVFGFIIILFGLNTLFNCILNGYRYIKYLVLSGIIGSVISVILALVITMRFGLPGALINSAIAQIFIFLVNMFFIKKLRLIKQRSINNKLDRILLWKLLKFALMSVISTLVVPTTVLFIRKYIISNFSDLEAGYVQGVWNISAAYLMVITSTLSIYYLPTLSSIKNNGELRTEIINGYKIILPAAIVGGLMVYWLRDLIINLLYTSSFEPMKDYFTFQIIGDTFKIASWIIAYIMVAKAMTRVFIITEIMFSANYLFLSIVFMKSFGSIGVTYAYSMNYLLYLLLMLVLFRKVLFMRTI